jgi:putative Mg2+ transporter-C (MgtC) family protein
MLYEEILGGLELPLLIVALRLCGATLLCALLGIEREMSGHAAGLRTHMLIGLAAAVYALLTLQLVAAFGDGPEMIRLDPIRVVEATTAGVAFLAAGTIVLRGGTVKGLTTGAVMWVAGAIGLSAGLGLWPIAVLTAVLALVISMVLRMLTRRLGEDDDAD